MAEQRASGRDRLGGGDRVELDNNVEVRAAAQAGQAVVMEGRDRSEGRVGRGEVAPTGAGLIDLEWCGSGQD
ncbi:MAG: hypothetical protein NVS1B1_00480 [Candidatus Limnocylindrales bacterium]